MKHILIFIFFSLSFALFGQNDTHPNFTQSQLDSALNGTKQVEIPSHFNSNGDKNTWDINLKDLGDVIKSQSNPSQIIALQDTSGCTSWTSASTNFQTDMPTADSLLFITINGINYTINLPMDDGSTGSIPPAIAALMQTAIGNAITSAGYSATTSVGASGIFTNITFQLTAGNSPLTIQYTIKTGGFYNNLVIAKSVPYNCTYTNRAIKPTDTQLAVNTCPAITLAYSEGNLDTLRVYDCNTNDWRIVGAEHDYNYSLSPLIVGVDTTGFILNKNGVPQDTVLLCSGGGNTVVDTRLQLSVANDSLKVEVIDVATNVVLSTSYFDDIINKPDLIQSAANDLRVSGTTILEGTDDPSNAKGSQLIYNTSTLMAGYYRQYLGANGTSKPSLKIEDNGNIYFGSPDFDNSSGGKSFIYLANKGAFSVGENYGESNVGNYSLRVGQYNICIPEKSGAIGENNSITGTTSPIGWCAINYAIGRAISINNSFATVALGNNMSLNNCKGVFASMGGGTIDAVSNSNALATDVTLIDGNNLQSLGTQSSIVSSVNIFNAAHMSQIFNAGNVSVFGFQPPQNLPNLYNKFDNTNTANFIISNGYNVPTGLGNGSAAMVQLKNGQTLINHLGVSTLMNDADLTPMSALDIVSITRGVLMPRLTSTEVSAWQSSFNTTTDVTGVGGTGNEKHSRQGETIYDLSQSKNMRADWNGTIWIFTTW